MDSLDLRILAAVQRRGRRLLTYHELEEEGASEDEILGRVRRGILQRVHKGVYLVGAGELTWEEQALAGVLAGGPTALASALAAIRLWDLGDFGTKTIDVAVDVTTGVSASGVRQHRTRRALPATIRHGVPCVSVEQALLDAAAILPERIIHRLLTKAWRMRHTTPRKVLLHVELYGGRGVKGTRRLRTVAQLYEDDSRGPGSDAESDFLFEFYAALEAAGIERPLLQFVIPVAPEREEKKAPDSVWPERWKVIEMMGLDAHGNYVTQADDIDRAAMIRAAGWELEEVAPLHIRERRTNTIARLIRFLQTPNTKWPGSAA